MTGVGGNFQKAVVPGAGTVVPGTGTVVPGAAAVLAAEVCAIMSGAMFDMTRQPTGAVTDHSKVALRSGWSKQA
jgi:hypothetical protein